MKDHGIRSARLLIFFLTANIQIAFGQGSLTPPGAPAPTMKSLDQIEPRSPVDSTHTPGDGNNLYIISQSGSYYLTTNIVTTSTYGGNGIEILANNVTLDLNGFSMSCTSTNNSTLGITMPNTQTNILIHNGNVNGWFYGVFSASGYTANLIIEKLNVANCNKPVYYGYGIVINGAAVIRDCTGDGNGVGISCNADVSPDGSLITGCTANHNSFDGIDCSGGGIISGCTANNNSSVGINILYNQYGYGLSDGCLVTKCTTDNNANGIYIQGARNRVDNNHMVNNSSYGIYVDSGAGSYTNNIIIGNSVERSGYANYIINGTQIIGPIITTTGIITNSNPWANFSF